MYALLDEASEASFIHTNLTKELRDVIVTDSLDVQLKVAPTKDDVQP